MSPIVPAETALLLVDMQNDFIHPDGAYARGGASADAIAALPARLAPVADAMRRTGGWIVSTHFTLVPGKGDFAPGGWGQALIDDLAPSDLSVEKVALSAFYMSRLDWVLQRAGIRHLIAGGIVTNGGVASTLRDAHVREYHVTVLSDGCAAFDSKVHEVNISALRSVADIATCADVIAALAGL